MSEFDLITRLQEAICIPPGKSVFEPILGIGDDSAVLRVPAGRELVVCTDSLVEGVHFPVSTPPAAIGHKALAVNLSDLAAMGAVPAWFFMALTLPGEDRQWLDSFAGGVARLAARARIQLSGGDVSAGPLSITITALGLVEPGNALLRSGAAPGDRVVLSGAPGAAANALHKLTRGEVPAAADRKALDYPEPRIDLGRMLAGRATSCIDLSDGLVADLGHVLRQSGVGAEIELEKLPCPESLRSIPGKDRWPIQLGGGDDYELCFTIPPGSAGEIRELSRASNVDLTVIGVVKEGAGLVFRTPDGKVYTPVTAGYRHFNGSEKEGQ